MSAVLPARFVLWALLFQLIARAHADPDLWGHVLFGRDIVRARGLPQFDSYAFTSDIPWVNHEWLSEVIMYAAFAAAGPLGLSVLRLGLLIATGVVVARALALCRLTPVTADLLFALVVFATMPQTMTMRPQLFSLLLFAITLLLLMRSLPDVLNCLALGLLMACWANLHGGWVVGAVTLVVWGLGEFVSRPTPRQALATLWRLAPVAGVLASPYGTENVRFIWDTVGLDRADITEWRGVFEAPLDGGIVVAWAVVAGLCVAAISTRRRLPPTHLLTVAMFAAGSFRVARLLSFFAIAAVTLLAVAWRSDTELGTAGLPGDADPTPRWALCLSGVVAAGLLVFGASRALCLHVAGGWTPDRTAARLLVDAQPTGRMITWFDWGEFVIWHLGPGVRVSMDGRRETVFSEHTRELHDAAYFGRPGGREFILALDADYAWLPPTLPLVGELERAGWTRWFAGTESVVLVAAGRALERPPDAAIASSARSWCFPGP